jgi:transcriptional regulator with XRE-family HTH domain
MDKTPNLRAFRKLNGLTQEELAAFLGVKKAFISQIETGRVAFPEDKLFRILQNDRGWDTSILMGDGSIVGDGNTVNNGRDQTITPDPGLVAALREAQAQNAKSQEQIDRLLGIIEGFQNSQK